MTKVERSRIKGLRKAKLDNIALWEHCLSFVSDNLTLDARQIHYRLLMIFYWLT